MDTDCMMASALLARTELLPQITRTVAVVPRSSVTAPARFRDYVRKQAADRGFKTLAELAQAADVNESALSRWLTGANGPSVEALRRIAPALGVRLGDLMIAAGMATPAELGMKGAPPPPQAPLPPELQRVVAKLKRPDVSEHHKRALLNGIARVEEIWEESREVPREPRMRRR
jgi:transcriptional regulator with XRE-family HTH domain